MSGTADRNEFSFNTISDFDNHIEVSIPDYARLITHVQNLSSYFVKDGTSVFDIGCSTGVLLSKLNTNDSVRFIGVDNSENLLGKAAQKKENISFVNADLKEFDFGANASLVSSLFTLQFIPLENRASIVGNVYRALNVGGAFIVAEKVYESSGLIQDIMTFCLYDYKRASFTEKEIIEKQRDLRYIMRPLSDSQNVQMFKNAGFSEIHLVWQSLLFKCWLCLKY